MDNNLYKRAKKGSFGAKVQSTFIWGLILILLSPAQSFSAEGTGSSPQNENQGITVEQAEARAARAVSQAQSSKNSNDFLSDNPLYPSDSRSIDTVGSIVDGNVTSLRTQTDGKIIATVKIAKGASGNTQANQNFYKKAAGPIQASANTDLDAVNIVFTLSGDGKRPLSAEFTDDGIKYKLVYGDDGQITQTIVKDMSDPANLSNNYNVRYKAAGDEITFDNPQNDGAMVTVVTSRIDTANGKHVRETILVQYLTNLTPEDKFATTVIRQDLTTGEFSLNTQFQFGTEPAYTFLSVRGTVKNPVLVVPTEYGDYTVSLSSVTNIYDFWNTTINQQLVILGERQFFLGLFAAQTGYQPTLNDLSNNIKVITSSNGNSYGELEFLGETLFLEPRITADGNYVDETMPLTVIADGNENGIFDSRDRNKAAAYSSRVTSFLNTGEVFDPADFTAHAVFLGGGKVYYQGQELELRNAWNRYLTIRYPDGKVTLIYKTGRNKKIFRHHGGRR